MEDMRPQRHVLIAAPLAVLTVALLAGCVPETGEQPEPTVTAAPSATPTPTESATPEPTPTVEIIPLDVACDALITPDEMYALNPNYSLLGAFVPDAGSVAANAVAQGGVACRWVQDTSGSTIDVSAAHLPESVSTALKNELVGSSNSVPTYTVEGYFLAANGVGTAQAFPDPYWVTVVSPTFFEPGDAAPLVAAAIAALG